MAKARPGRAVTGKIRHYDIHPVAEAFPLLEGDGYDRVKASIEAHGQRIPIVLAPDGRIVDGRGRYMICGELGIEPNVYKLAHNESLVMASADFNAARRDMTNDQRWAAFGALRPHVEAEALARSRQGAKTPVPFGTGVNRSCDILACILGVSSRTAARAIKTIDKAIPAITDLMKSGELSPSLGADVADLPEDVQEGIAYDAHPREAALDIVRPDRQPEEATTAPPSAKPRKPRKPKREPGKWPKDEQGNDIPEAMQAVMAQSLVLKELKARAGQLRRDIEEVGMVAIGAYLPVDKIHENMKAVTAMIRDSLPWAVCNECGGDGGECCRRQGWVTKRWHGLQGNKA